MSLARVRRPTLVVLSLLLALTVLSFAPQPAAPAPGGNTIAMKAPSFIKVANAQDESAAAPMGFPQDEAGISAYFKSATPITLADVRSVFRVIEVETADHIIGSVQVPDWWESYDVHVYVHKDGWFLAYYPKADVIGKIIDWKRYVGTRIPTKLESVLTLVASSAGVPFPGATFYDFRYPNATNMMIIVEDTNDGSSFQVNVPGGYAQYARSWSLVSYQCPCGYYGGSTQLFLDGVKLEDQGEGYKATEGNLAVAQLLPDAPHDFHMNTFCKCANCALALIYRVP